MWESSPRCRDAARTRRTSRRRRRAPGSRSPGEIWIFPDSRAVTSPSTPLNCRQSAERQIHLGDRAVHAVVLQLLQEAGLQDAAARPGRAACAFGIGVRDDGASLDLVAVGQNDAGSDAIVHLDTGDLARRANLRARRLRRRSHRCRQARPCLPQCRTPVPPGCCRRQLAAAASRSNLPTTARGTFRRSPARRSFRAAIRSRTIPRPGRQPPSVPSAAAGTDLSRPVRESSARSSAAPKDCSRPDRRCPAASCSSAARRPRRCGPATC